MLLHRNRRRHRQQQPQITDVTAKVRIVRSNNTICTSFQLFLLSLIVLVPYQSLFPQPLNVIVMFVDGWKIGNLFQRHHNNDGNEQSSHIGIQNDHDDIHNNIDDDSVLAPAITPTIAGSTSPDSSCSLKPQAKNEVPSSPMDTTPVSSLLSMLRQSCQIPVSLYQKMQLYYDASKEQILAILIYRPPVGIVSIFVLLRFFARSKRYLFLSNDERNENVEDRKSTRLNSSHLDLSRMPSSA